MNIFKILFVYCFLICMGEEQSENLPSKIAGMCIDPAKLLAFVSKDDNGYSSLIDTLRRDGNKMVF